MEQMRSGPARLFKPDLSFPFASVQTPGNLNCRYFSCPGLIALSTMQFPGYHRFLATMPFEANSADRIRFQGFVREL